MNHRYHVYTPMWRLGNISKLVAMLEPMGIQWHPIYDDGASWSHPNRDWIHALNSGPVPRGWHPASWKDNWFLDHEHLEDMAKYVHLSDDDRYDDDFFHEVDRHSGEDVIIVSMMNGPTPQGKRENLWAEPGRIAGGKIGAQQIIVSGYIARHYRYGPAYDGDWKFILDITSHHPYVFAREAKVFWNDLD